MKNLIIILSVVAVFLTMGMGVLAFFCCAHAVEPSKFNRVMDGMTKSQVIDIMGKPDGSGRFDEPGTMFFIYGGSSHYRWCTMAIFFRTNGLAGWKFHDH